MSFLLRQRGKDVGKTTSLHFLVVQSQINRYSGSNFGEENLVQHAKQNLCR